MRGAAGDRPRSPAQIARPTRTEGPRRQGPRAPRRDFGFLGFCRRQRTDGGNQGPVDKRPLGRLEAAAGDPGVHVSGRERAPPGLRIALHKVSAAQGGSSVRGDSPDSGHWSALPLPPSRNKPPERKPGRAGARVSPATEKQEAHQEQRPKRGQQVHQPEREGRVLAVTV